MRVGQDPALQGQGSLGQHQHDDCSTEVPGDSVPKFENFPIVLPNISATIGQDALARMRWPIIPRWAVPENVPETKTIRRAF